MLARSHPGEMDRLDTPLSAKRGITREQQFGRDLPAMLVADLEVDVGRAAVMAGLDGLELVAAASVGGHGPLQVTTANVATPRRAVDEAAEFT